MFERPRCEKQAAKPPMALRSDGLARNEALAFKALC